MLGLLTITHGVLSKLLGVNIRTIRRNIKTFIELGLIERIGAMKKVNGLLLRILIKE